MKTNTVPSLGIKGNGKSVGLYVGDSYEGYGIMGVSASDNELVVSRNAFNVTIPKTGLSTTAVGLSNPAFGVVKDSSKSGIITDTGSMSSVTSKAIIKY